MEVGYCMMVHSATVDFQSDESAAFLQFSFRLLDFRHRGIKSNYYNAAF